MRPGDHDLSESGGLNGVQAALLLAGGLIAAWLYASLWPVETPDMSLSLVPWYGHIVEHGLPGAFAIPFSNYTPPYLYLLAIAAQFDGLVATETLIKFVSIAGTAFLALGAFQVLRAAGARQAALAASCLFLLPTVAINAAGFAQCDAMWSGASLFAVAAALRGRMAAMLVWAGVAIAFKAQAAFIAPFILLMLLRHRVPFYLWLIPPAVYLAAALPAWAAGWPLLDLLLVYPRQSGYFTMAGNLANPWAAIGYVLGDDAAALYGIGIAAAVVATGLYLRAYWRRSLDQAALLSAALLPALMLPLLLPKMHERYFFLADVLAFCLAAATRDRRAIDIAMAIQFASLTAYFGFYTNWLAPPAIGSILAILALLLLVRGAGPVSAPAAAPPTRPSAHPASPA